MNIRNALKPFNEKREYRYAGKFVSPEGMSEIKHILLSDTASDGGYNFDIPDDFDPTWLITSGELQGTLPKRLSHLYYKNVGRCRTIKNLPTKIMAQIGNIASKHCGNGQDYIYDITEKFDWRAGDFGDEGSCFFGSRSEARDMMSENKSLAIRFYNGDVGYGRAWIAFPKTREISVSKGPKPADICIVFNSYPSSHPLCRVARLLATILGLSYKGPIDFSNNGESGGTLWINGERCYVIGQDIENITEVNLQWEDRGVMTCADCGEEITGDNYRNNNDEDICESCYSNYFSCERCGVSYRNSEEVVVNGDSYCERCAEKRGFAPCSDCGEWLDEEFQKEGEGKTYCESCWEEYFGDCKECGETFGVFDLEDGKCKDCRPTPCDRCEIKFEPADLEDGLCEECRKETA